ncbi:hypothetical protein [Halorussus sp. MSC15.2]|uniref:hypothetical protein n=1 Tax=Halorussus sp. MSC15.2 TaxID=2283638 RepID=UPI0013D3B6CE|nr:hypothetical protein [Halorussus sp. MSC15.2]NEU57876.1 hypothetical protein [Halorussus sp. MSC15.2]
MRVPFASTADPERDRRVDADSTSATGLAPRLAARIAEGTRAGFVATLVMTAYRLPVSRSLPPTARFWSTFVSGDDPDDHPIIALALHLLYGTVGGAIFGALTPFDAGSPASSPRSPTGDESDRSTDDDHRQTASREVIGLLWGTVYALALSVFGERVVLGRVLDMDPEVDERLVFHAGHLVYGLSLGTLFGSRTSDEE